MSKNKAQKNIPDKWQEKKFADVFKIGSGKDYKHLGHGDVPVFGTGGYMLSVNKSLYSGKTVFIGRKGTIDKPFYYDGDFWTVDTLFYTYDFKDTTAEFVNLIFQKIQWKKYNEASGVPSLSKTTIEKIKFIFPPLSEQNAIVKILEIWDEYLEKLSRKIEIKKNIKKGLMCLMMNCELLIVNGKEVYAPKLRLPEFSGEWENVKLGDVGNTYQGITGKSKDDFGKGKPFISYMNIYSNSKLNIQINNFVDIRDGEKQNKVKYGDLFFTTSSETPNEVGISSVLLDKNIKNLYLNSFCFGFRLHNFKTLIPEFAQFYFRSQNFRKQMTRIAQGASRFNLSKRYFLVTKIKIPKDVKEQIAIAKILTTADEEIEVLEKKKKIIEEQKKFLLNNLVTGRIRV